MKITINTLRKFKEKGQKAVWVTSYDYPQARLADEAGVDMILVGDSAGNTTHGYSSTIPMTMDKMLVHAEAVARGSKNAFLVGDMPYMSYQISDESAIENAGSFIRTGMDAIKLEGCSQNILSRVSSIRDAGILVIGHIGLTPQSQAQLGGYKVQGKTQEQVRILTGQAMDLEDAGCCVLLLEAMPPEASEKIVKELKIPVYGIGAGDGVDGQLVIIHDLLGLSFEFNCKFVKKYLDGGDLIRNALQQYAKEVRSEKFPSKEHFYGVTPSCTGRDFNRISPNPNSD